MTSEPFNHNYPTTEKADHIVIYYYNQIHVGM